MRGGGVIYNPCVFIRLYFTEVKDKIRTNSASEIRLRNEQLAAKKREDDRKRKADAQAEKLRVKLEKEKEKAERKLINEQKVRARQERKSVRDKEQAEKYRQKEIEKEKKEIESRKQRTLDSWVQLKIPVHAAQDSEWSAPESGDESELDNISVTDDSDEDKTLNYNKWHSNKCTLKKEKVDILRAVRVYVDSTDEEILDEDPDIYQLHEKKYRESLFPGAKSKLLYIYREKERERENERERKRVR